MRMTSCLQQSMVQKFVDFCPWRFRKNQLRLECDVAIDDNRGREHDLDAVSSSATADSVDPSYSHATSVPSISCACRLMVVSGIKSARSCVGAMRTSMIWKRIICVTILGHASALMTTCCKCWPCVGAGREREMDTLRRSLSWGNTSRTCSSAVCIGSVTMMISTSVESWIHRVV